MRRWQAAAECGTVHRGDERLAGLFDVAEQLLQLEAVLRCLGRVLAFFQHADQIAAGDEVILRRGDDHALHGLVGNGLVHGLAKRRNAGLVHDVHRPVGHVPDDRGDAVAIDSVIDHVFRP